jgi:DNA repair exonuclease SbcCD ATPase subunit
MNNITSSPSLDNTLDRYKKLKVEKDILNREVSSLKKEIDTLQKDLEDYTKAKWALTEAVRITQERFKNRVESLVTLAIQSVFDRLFKFRLDFLHERGRFSCKPVIIEGSNEYEAKDDMGGSIVDLISFAFRVVLWSLENPRSRPFFVLDEPMKWLGSGEELLRGGKIIREISHRLGFQILIVTHLEPLAEIADTAWQVKMIRNRSIVKVLKEPPKKKLVKRKRASNRSK